MPWQEASLMSLRHEFIALATQEGANIRALCRRFEISPKTGYKWLARYQQAGLAGLADRSRRPHHTPGRTPAAVEARVLALRDTHPRWGGRKLKRRLEDQQVPTVPAASTITAILRRHDRIEPAATAAHTPWQRFAHPAPNDLWQLDFRGHQPLAGGRDRCHPLSVLDDHSRFLLGLVACPDEQETTVRAALTQVFRRYGVPRRILSDNGPPWGAAGLGGVTRLELWWVRLGITVRHGRPYHPQTQGKVERFHRTLAAELGGDDRYPDLATAQRAYSHWRAVYNLERPHEALGLAVPAQHYQPSPRPFPETLPPLEYAPDDQVRRVQSNGTLSYRNTVYRVGKALAGEQVGLRPATTDGHLAVYYGWAQLGHLDLRGDDRTLIRAAHLDPW